MADDIQNNPQEEQQGSLFTSPGFDTKEYITHHLNFLQIDLSTGNVLHSKKVDSVYDFNECLCGDGMTSKCMASPATEEQCLIKFHAADCK